MEQEVTARIGVPESLSTDVFWRVVLLLGCVVPKYEESDTPFLWRRRKSQGAVGFMA